MTMLQISEKKPALSTGKLITLEEFLDWYCKDAGSYELHNGVIVEMTTIGTHELVGSFLTLKLGFQIEYLGLDYAIPKDVFIKPIDSDKSGFKPDLIILDKKALNNEPMWQKRSTITLGKTVRLVIEVVSTNWEDDYQMKLECYEKLGIPEYWIVDYLGLGGRRFIGNPKQPTISIYKLIEDEYMVKQFRGDERLESAIFPDLNLTAQQVFNEGNFVED
jgi:Uma2 family endonuclease